MNFSFIKFDWIPSEKFQKKVFYKIKFNKNLAYKLKFYAESIASGIKHVWMHLHALKLIFVELN